MALQFANVTLSDTFDSWRIRTNETLTAAISGTSTTAQVIAANTTFSANLAVSGTLSGDVAAFSGPMTSPIVTANTLSGTTIIGTLSTSAQPNITSIGTLSVLAVAGDISADVITANSFSGDGSGLSGVATDIQATTAAGDRYVVFNSNTSGTTTVNDVDVNLKYNPGTGVLTANAFVGDGSGLENAGATVASKSDNVDYKVTFTNQLNGSHANTFINTSFLFNPSTGECSATNFNSTSDISYKEDIKEIDNASNIISKLSGMAFRWKQTGKKSYGVIAQDIEKVLPDVVVQNDNGKAVNYNTLIAFLIESNKELQNRINTLESKLK